MVVKDSASMIFKQYISVYQCLGELKLQYYLCQYETGDTAFKQPGVMVNYYIKDSLSWSCLVVSIRKYRILKSCPGKMQNLIYMIKKPKYRIFKSETLDCFSCFAPTLLGLTSTMRRASMNLDNGVIVQYMKYECRNNMAVGGKGKKGQERNISDGRLQKTTIRQQFQPDISDLAVSHTLKTV